VLRNVNLAGVSNGRVTSDLGGVLALELHGTSPSLLTGRGTITLDSSQLRGAPLGPGELRLELDSGQLRVEGGMELLRGRMELVGSARPFVATPVFQVERATFREVDVGAVSTGQRRLPLSGVLGLRGTLPQGSLPELEGEIELEPSPFNGGRIEHARAEVSLHGGEARVNLDARTGDGSVGLKAAAALGRTAAVAGESGWALTSARLDGSANLPDLAQLLGRGPVDAGLLAGVHLEGRGADPDTMEWAGRLTFSGSWDEARVDSVRLEARISGGRLELDTLLVASNVVDGFGHGSVALSNARSAPSDSLKVHLQADTAGAAGRAGIASVVGIRPFGLRSMQLDLLAYNAGQGVQLDATGGAGGVIVGDVAADSLEVALTAFPRTQGLVEVEASLTGRRLAWQRFELESLDARASRDSSGFGFAAEATRDAGHTFEIAGQGRAGERRLRLSRLGFGFGAERWSLADTASVSWGDRVTFGDFSLRFGNRRIGLEGSLDRAGLQNLTLTLDSVPIGRFAEFAGIDGLEGTLHGTFGLEGPAERIGLRTDLALALEGLTGRITTEPRGGQLAVDVNLVNPAGNSLRVTGTVPNRLSPGSGDGARRAGEEISLGIRAEAFPVDWLTPFLRPAGVERFEGTIDSDIRLVGTVAQPQASGTARIAAGRITMPRTGVDVRRIDGDLALAGRRIQVQHLRAEAGGSMAVEGDVILEPLDNPRFALQARFEEFRPVRTEWIALGLDGRIDVAGDLEHPRLTGSVTLVRTDVFADRVGQAQALRPVELTARDYAMLESYFGYRRAADVRTSDPLAPWTIDVALAVGGDVWLRKRVRPEMRILLSGSLDVRKQPGDSLQLFGTVRAVPGRSSVEQLGKRFEIEDGSITFNGLASGWRADINARYAVPAFQDPSASEVVITMEVTGGVNDLRLTLGSEPAMETTDVLSYLATGRPAASAAEFGASSGGNGLSGQGASLALGTVAGLLEEQGGDRIGLDVVEIRQGGPDGTTVVAGRYVSPRLYVGFQQPLVERNQGEGIEENGLRTQVEVEFAAFRWLLINLQGGRSELRWFFRTRHAF
jgi:translocation and assembly module TamB